MPKLIATTAVLAALSLGPVHALAQEEWNGAQPEVTPDGAAPSWTPPPPAETPAPPEVQQQPQQAQVPPGQWVYTEQYGWLWMPHSDAYTQVPPSGWGTPYAYVYYPAYSTWTWVAAPWVWGIGPWPVFGAWGPARFGWYGHGWWRSPYRWHYAPAHAWYPGGGWRASAPYRGAPYRGGGAWMAPRGGFVASPAPGAHAFRGGGRAPVRGGGHGR